MCRSCLANDTHMLIENNKIYCVHCQEYVSYDGGNWVNCHCFGCRDDEPENFPAQWGVDTNFESRPTQRAQDGGWSCSFCKQPNVDEHSVCGYCGEDRPRQ